jgi:hypothetical protein
MGEVGATPAPTPSALPCSDDAGPPPISLERADVSILGLPVNFTFEGPNGTGIYQADGFFSAHLMPGNGPLRAAVGCHAELIAVRSTAWWPAPPDGPSWVAAQPDGSPAPSIEPMAERNAFLLPPPPPGRWQAVLPVIIRNPTTGTVWRGQEILGVWIGD